tara:strand:+ start:1474 stop:1701 length:228 start_codon:yes stop_codon:yes gene_type:complete
MAHLSTLKAEIKKQFGNDFKIVEVKKGSFGMLTIKIHKEQKKSTKLGLIFSQTNWDINEENGIVLDKKVEWLGTL